MDEGFCAVDSTGVCGCWTTVYDNKWRAAFRAHKPCLPSSAPHPPVLCKCPSGPPAREWKPVQCKNAHYRVKLFVFRSAVIATLRLSTLFAVEWDTNAESS